MIRGQVVGRQRHLVVEVGALEDAGELLRVGAADRGQRVVQSLALQRLVGVADVVPAVAVRDLEDVEGGIARELLGALDVAELRRERPRSPPRTDPRRA